MTTPPAPAPTAAAVPHGTQDAPAATYRLQLQPDFPFAAAERAVPGIARLGVTHLHLSPVLGAVPGSPHGYDVTDHGAVRAELGGEDGLRSLAATARAHGLGLVVDVVPNHMAVPADTRLNRPLWEVLREGPSSPYARWFDIDWEACGGRVLLPVLGAPVHEELARLRVADGTLHYYDRVLPLRAGTEELPIEALVEAQHYRLAWWRAARTDLNYRRFFTISDLIGVRVEDPEVFDATHGTLLRLLHEGVIQGLRVDHPDGLADPGGYLRRLCRATGGRWTVVEKILGAGEALPDGWPVAGTTGYDALHHVDGLFTDPEGHTGLVVLHQDVTRAAPDAGGEWTATARRAAEEVVTDDLAAETSWLTRVAARACHAAPGLRLRDHSGAALRTALRRMLVRLPVYRTYVTPGLPAGKVDARMLRAAADGARAVGRRPEEALAVDVVRDLASGTCAGGADIADDSDHAASTREFACRFGQVSSALRAKSLEDRAFYRFTPLLSACEVGGEPVEPAVSPGTFHAFCERLHRDWPDTGTVLSTHDTKRSADVRAALAVLSEAPRRWAGTLAEVAAATAQAPDPHLAWTAWQLAYGLGEPDPDRLAAAVLKSAREAGLHTTWTEQHEEYEAAAERFVRQAVCGPAWTAIGKLAQRLAPYARANVLGMALLHLTMPGVPDLYQGTERTARTLVDPDNRRPVDRYGVPQESATGDAGPSAAAPDAGTAGAGTAGAVAEPETGLAAEKLRLTREALRLRRDHPEWFGAAGSYRPLTATGPALRHCVAFARADRVVTAVTRLSLRLAESGGWRDTALRLPAGDWVDVLSGRPAGGGEQRAADLFADAPVALLVRR